MAEEEKKTKKKTTKNDTAKTTKKKTTTKTNKVNKEKIERKHIKTEVEIPKKVEVKKEEPIHKNKKVEPVNEEPTKEKTSAVIKKNTNKLTTREKFLIGLTVFTMIVTAVMYYWMFGDKYYSYKASWGINMPNVLTEIYSVKGEKDQFGDYNTYHIYKYENEEDVKDFVKWTSVDGETVQYDTYEETAEEWLNVLAIEQKNRPNYDDALYYYTYDDQSNEVVFIKNNKEKKLYVLEYFMKDE